MKGLFDILTPKKYPDIKPEYKLYLAIWNQALKDGDLDFFYSKMFEEQADMLGLDHEYMREAVLKSEVW